MKATISKDFAFSSSHQLEGLPADHPCSRMHGHNYTVRVEITGEVTEPGFVIDYRQLGWFKDLLDDRYDHRHLNDLVPFNPTAENLAAHFRYLVASHLEGHPHVESIAVAVSETPKTWATVSA